MQVPTKWLKFIIKIVGRGKIETCENIAILFHSVFFSVSIKIGYQTSPSSNLQFRKK
jgi:hypothetical protein